MAATTPDRPILPIGSFHPPEMPGRPAAEVLAELVWQDPGRVSGAPCFRGTRVPVYIMLEHVREGTLDEFLDGFPDVDRQTAKAVLDAIAWLFLEQRFTR